MKKVILFLLFFAALASVTVGQNANDWFVTRWIAPANGTIKFPAIGSGYTIRYVPIDHITGAPIGAMQTIFPASSGQVISGLTAGWTYRIDAFGGTFNQLSFDTYSDNKIDIVSVEQWGTIVWNSFALAFYECINMDVIATDKPNLVSCTNLDRMFFGCTSLVNTNSSISSWTTDNVVVLGGMFAGATNFNKPLNWNTANVQTMAWMFSGAVAFNQPINFDTRNVLDMGHMFVGASAFNSPFGSNWNTEKVTNMESMFRDATVFDQPIGNWNTSQVVDMKRMFEMARAFNQDISGWNTEKVQNMGGMFNGAVAFNQPIGGWNTQSLESTFAMFWGATSFNKPLNWNTPNLNNTYGMFNGATSFNSPLTFSSTANVTNMMNMFNGATSFNQPLNFNTQSVTNMSAMFYNAHSFNNDLYFSNTQNVTSTAAMFYNALAFDKPIGYWNLQSVTDMSFMFQGAAAFNQTINFNTQSATTMKGMFSGAIAFNSPFGSNFNTQNVADMSYMFDGATDFDQPIGGFRINSVTTMTDMLKGCGMNCQNLSSTLDGYATQAAALGKNNISLGNLNVDQYYNANGQSAIAGLQGRGWTINGGTFATNCILPTNAKEWFVTVWDMSKPTIRTNGNPATTIAIHAYGANYTIYWEDVDNTTINGVVTVPYSDSNTPYYLNVPSSTGKYRLRLYKGAGFFSAFTQENLSPNRYDAERLIAVEQWGTTKWASFQSGFLGCINMDVTATDQPDISKCTDFLQMFVDCKSLVNANGSMSGWQTQSVRSMYRMFKGAVLFNQPIGNWNTSNVINMFEMFRNAETFNQPLNWNTQNVIDMSWMFCGAKTFNQPIGNWNTQNVTDMSSMFLGATAFNQPIDNWNTQNVTNMGYIFFRATSFNQPISNWNTEKVTNMERMFTEATSFDQPLSFSIKSVTTLYDIISLCGISCQNTSTTLNNFATQAVAFSKKIFNF